MINKITLLILFTCFFLYAPLTLSAPNNHGAVSSGHPLATQVGLNILKKGGNAFDAAVAVSAVLNVLEPAMCGLGGYGSTLIYDTDKNEVRFLNSSGKFPFQGLLRDGVMLSKVD